MRGNFGQFDLSGARSLLIAGEAASNYRTANIGGMKKLFKLNAEGKVVPVGATSPTGATLPIDMIQPLAIYEVNSEFLLLGTMSGSYLVRRTDGKAAWLGVAGMMPNQHVVDTDKQGNIYFNDNGSLHKITTINLENPDQIVKTTLNQSDIERVQEFAVDPQGNILVSLFRMNSQNSGANLRLYKATGGIDLLPFTEFMGYPWTGRDGKLYVGTYGSESRFQHVFLDATNKASASAIPLAQSDDQSAVYHRLDPQVLRADLPEQTVVGGTYSESTYPSGPPSSESPNVQPVYVERAVVHFAKGLQREALVLTQTKKLLKLTASDTTVYALGLDSNDQTIVLKLNPLTRTETRFFQDANLEILQISATPDDRLTITALRSTDGNYLVGEIDSSGELSVITSDLPPVQQMLTLE
jgi:hypothetical protein